MSILFSIILYSVTLYILDALVPGFTINAGATSPLLIYSVGGLVVYFIYSIIYPLTKILTFPFIIITLGLFTFLLNIWMIILLDWLVPAIQIQGLATIIVVSIALSFAGMISKLFANN